MIRLPRLLAVAALSVATSAVVALAVLAGPSAQAQRLSSTPFIIMQHSNTNAVAGVFHLNTETGAIRYCFLNEQKAVVSCTAANLPTN
ncbi:MAG: hypothetical protein IPI58_05535 [Alphaproteobacteria bacterium]|nr:MAG: hypothetical protein IPI58_05535 [Alphaproteobacteria bacterium]